MCDVCFCVLMLFYSPQLAPCTLDKEYKRFQSALEAYCSRATSVEANTLMEDTVFSVKKNDAGEWVRARRVDQSQVSCWEACPAASVIVPIVASHLLFRLSSWTVVACWS